MSLESRTQKGCCVDIVGWLFGREAQDRRYGDDINTDLLLVYLRHTPFLTIVKSRRIQNEIQHVQWLHQSHIIHSNLFSHLNWPRYLSIPVVSILAYLPSIEYHIPR